MSRLVERQRGNVEQCMHDQRGSAKPEFGGHPGAMGSEIAVRVPTARRLRIKDMLTYGPLVRALASRDLKARYKQSALGPAWVVFQPLALLGVFSIGFRSVARVPTGGVDYAVFALSGLVVWSYFQAVAMVSVGSLVNNYALVRWTACPRLTLPLATLISNLPSLLIPAVGALIAAAAYGYLRITWLLVPLLIAWLLLLVAMIAVLLAAAAVRARDVLSVTPFLLQVALFLSPVAYRTGTLSPVLRTLVSINPLSGLIDAWRWSLLGITPSRTAVVMSLLITTFGTVATWRFFGSFEVRMADEI